MLTLVKRNALKKTLDEKVCWADACLVGVNPHLDPSANNSKWLYMHKCCSKKPHNDRQLLSSLLSHHARFSPLMTTCVCVSPARTIWSASQCCASTALPPSSPHPPSCFGQFTPLQAYAAAAQLALPVITARRRSTCVTPTPALMEAYAPAEREGTPVSAVKTTPVSREGSGHI